MGLRYRKSVKLGPFRATVSKSGISYSAGGKGARITKRADGRVQTTLSVPKTGVSYTTTQHRQKPTTQRRQKPSTHPTPRASRPVAHTAKTAKTPLPGRRTSLPPRPPVGWVSPRVFKGRSATVSIGEQSIHIERDAAGRIGNRPANIQWQEVTVVDFLEPKWGRLGHVHFVTSTDPRGLTVGGRGNPAAAAGRNPHTIQFSSRQRANYEDLRRFIGG
jgi:Protein of unknown function (DUF4236)